MSACIAVHSFALPSNLTARALHGLALRCLTLLQACNATSFRYINFEALYNMAAFMHCLALHYLLMQHML